MKPTKIENRITINEQIEKCKFKKIIRILQEI